jgi:hypothetical protein
MGSLGRVCEIHLVLSSLPKVVFALGESRWWPVIPARTQPADPVAAGPYML